MFEDSLRLVTATNDPREASDFGLVLSAVALPHRVVDRLSEPLPVGPPDNDERFCVIVSVEDVDRAHALLDAEREETRRKRRDRADLAAERAPNGQAIAISLALCAFLAAVYYTAPGWASFWGERWANDAQRVAAGEWWRPITAVFVHGDLKHIANNLSFLLPAALFASLRLGSGFVVFGFVATGWLGNIASLAWHGPMHRSVGASGAVFGTIGLLVGAALASSSQRFDPKRRRRELIGAALAILGLTAFAQNADMMAHLAGFVVGVGLGAALLKVPSSFGRQVAASAVALAVVCAAFLNTL